MSAACRLSAAVRSVHAPSPYVSLDPSFVLLWQPAATINVGIHSPSQRLQGSPETKKYDFVQALKLQAKANARHRARNNNMYPTNTDLAYAAACGYVGKQAVSKVNNDPAAAEMYRTLVGACNVRRSR